MAQVRTPSGAIVDDVSGQLVTPPPTNSPTPSPAPTPTPAPAPIQGAQTPEQIAAAARDGGMQPQPQPQPTPQPQPAVPAPAPVVPAPEEKSYVVQSGDSLARIALKFGVPISQISGYRSGDPNKIFPGETLRIGSLVPTQKPAAPTQPTQPTLPTDPSLSDPSNELAKFFSNIYGQNPDALQYGFYTNPMKTVKDLVAEVMEATGLPDAKAQINEIAKEIEDLENKRDDEIEAINDNPWISESTKRARIEKITDKYDGRISARTDRLSLVQSAYDDARQQSQFAATTAINLYDRNRNFDQGRLEFALTEAEKFLSAKNKSTDRDTQIVEVGSRKVLVDTQTGETIKDLGPSSSPTPGSTRSGTLNYSAEDYSADSRALEQSRGPDGYVNSETYRQLYNAWVDAGGSSKDFIAKFPPKLYANPADSSLPPILRNTSGSSLDADIDAIVNAI